MAVHPRGRGERFVFRGKNLVPTARWADVWRDAHDAGFMVAGAAKADLLAELKGAVNKAISQGTTLAEFRQDFDRIVARHGWTGWTGSDTEAGRAWRTELIYQTNLRTSYQAGRWQQVQAGKARRPYLIYRHSDLSVHPRPLHKSWDGLVVHADDPWVQAHWPPNGWGCKCRMFALSERDLRDMGKDGPDTPPDDGSYDWTDKVTGEVHRVPKGIDPGWDYAPGATRVAQLTKDLQRKAANLPAAIGAKLAETTRLGLPDLHTALAKAEDEIAGGLVETTVVFSASGQELLRKSGDANSVPFTPEETGLLKDAVVTHNHPVLTSFSTEDMELFIRHDLQELRAVDAKWLYVVTRTIQALSAEQKDSALASIYDAESRIWSDATSRLLRGEISEDEFASSAYHWAWESLDTGGLFSYQRNER